jgi:hypothetical protein
MGGLEGPPKPPDARQRPGEAVALLDSPPMLGSAPAKPWRSSIPAAPTLGSGPAKRWRSSSCYATAARLWMIDRQASASSRPLVAMCVRKNSW